MNKSVKENKRLNSIMDQIKAGLIGGYRTDMNYLQDEMMKYHQEFTLYMDVLTETGKIMYNRLPEEKKCLIDEPNKGGDWYKEMLEKYGRLLEDRDFDSALEMWHEMNDIFWLLYMKGICSSLERDFI